MLINIRSARDDAKHIDVRPSIVCLGVGFILVSLSLLTTPISRPAAAGAGSSAKPLGRVEPISFGDFRIFNKIKGPDSLSSEFFAFVASGTDLKSYMLDKFGIDCGDSADSPRSSFERCIRRHSALFYGDYLVQGGTSPRPFPIPQCDSIGFAYAKEGRPLEGDVGGAQSSVFLRDITYSGHTLEFLVKTFKERAAPKPFQERKGLNRLVHISEDPNNARRRDKGPYARESDAFQRFPPSPYFICPVCFWDTEQAILYPYYGAGDMITLVEDEDILESLDVSVFRRLAAQFIEAVSLMHAAGITHMDIKPENVIIAGKTRQSRLSFFLDPASKIRIMLIDFGLCIKEADFKGLGCVKAGTKVTMAPEQILCHRPLSPACDWWGVAATLWRIRILWDPDMDDDRKTALLDARDPHWQHPVIKKIDSFGPDFNELMEEMLQLYPEYRQFDKNADKLYSLKYLN